MAKILNLYLDYKSKPLDYVKYGKDFTKRFFIGSSKYLFFQILDDTFPEKHLFVTQRGDQFFMQLTPGAKLSCTKDGQPVDSSYLTQNNLLRGTELELKPDMVGVIDIAPNYEIKYIFKEPWINVLTPEEKQIAAQYARYSAPTAMERFNRNLILLFLFLAIVFILIFDLALKQKFSYDVSLEQKLATLQKAELVKAEALEQRSTFEDQAPVGEQEAETAPKETAQTGTTTGTGTSSKSAGSIFGGNFGAFDPNATSSAPTIKAVTIAEGFAAARPGRSGGGSGPGGGAAGVGGGGTAFNPSATGGSFSSDIGSVVTNAPRIAGSNVRPDAGTVVKASGDQSRLAPSGVVFGQTAKSSQLASSFKSKKVAQVSEGSIAAEPVETRTRYEVINNTISARRSQMNALYQKWNAITPFSGSASIRLLISASGNVEATTITPNGQMPEGFLNELKTLCEGWSFNVNQESDYTFSARFRKG